MIYYATGMSATNCWKEPTRGDEAGFPSLAEDNGKKLHTMCNDLRVARQQTLYM